MLPSHQNQCNYNTVARMEDLHSSGTNMAAYNDGPTFDPNSGCHNSNTTARAEKLSPKATVLSAEASSFVHTTTKGTGSALKCSSQQQEQARLSTKAREASRGLRFDAPAFLPTCAVAADHPMEFLSQGWTVRRPKKVYIGEPNAIEEFVDPESYTAIGVGLSFHARQGDVQMLGYAPVIYDGQESDVRNRNGTKTSEQERRLHYYLMMKHTMASACF